MRRMNLLALVMWLALGSVAVSDGLASTNEAKAGHEARSEATPRMLIIIADGFNQGEYAWPYAAMRAMGYEVDIAGPKKGVIETGNKGRPDAVANLSLAEVKVSDYLGLMIPGGYSPAKLAEYDDSFRICREFMEANKPVGAICHGPRLLMQAGLLRDRVTVGLWSIKDELPQLWQERAFGKYIDDPTVIDGNLLSGRHVADLGDFVPEFLDHLAERGGIQRARMRDGQLASMVVIFPGASGHERWLFTQVVEPTRVSSAFARTTADLDKIVGEHETSGVVSGMDALVVNGEEGLDGFKDNAAFKRVVDRAVKADLPIFASEAGAKLLTSMGVDGKKIRALTGSVEDRLAMVCPAARAERLSRAPESQLYGSGGTPRVAIALHPGFDDHVYAMVRGWLEYRGEKVMVLGPERGWIRGLNGLPVKVDRPFEGTTLPQDALIVAPGVVWPDVEEGAKTQAARIEWIRDRYEKGAFVLAFGHDSLEVSKHEMFKGKDFASSHQAVWAFKRKEGGSYSKEEALRTTDRLITAKGAQSVGEALRMLEEALGARPGEQTAQAGARPMDRDLVVAITADGALYLNGQKIEKEGLAKHMQEAGKRERAPRVRLEVDSRASVKDVVAVMDMAQLYGLNVGVRTRDAG